MSTLEEITQAIERLDAKEQFKLLQDLPRHLKVSADEVAWCRLAEPAFEFWNNSEDALYDEL